VRQLTVGRLFLVAAVAGSGFAASLPAASAQPVSAPPQSVWSGVYSDAQAYRGEKVADTLCLGCHGAGLAGGDSGPRLVGESFLAKWDGASLGDLYGWILEKMPDDAPGTLNQDDVASVVAYILKVNDMPSGKQALPADHDALAPIAIAIAAAKP
jgi:mono/diheme cytochrome c family protein